MSSGYERCLKCSKGYRTDRLVNGLCLFCQPKPEPEEKLLGKSSPLTAAEWAAIDEIERHLT